MTARPVVARDGRAAHSTEERLLDAFAARAAHVVGAGVSIAGGYAALLRERCADEMGDAGQAALDGVDRGLARLRLFVDDLLELAALEAAPMRREPLHATGAARGAVDGLAGALDAANVEVEVGTLPDLVADASLLERLFHHLLRGSLSAIGNGPGRIEIAGVRRAAGTRIEVADDGPALDPHGATTLFEPFAMPRGAGPAAGAGVSMAIARRIAERHGGSAWAHTGRREGCTIIVLLPEAL